MDYKWIFKNWYNDYITIKWFVIKNSLQCVVDGFQSKCL